MVKVSNRFPGVVLSLCLILFGMFFGISTYKSLAQNELASVLDEEPVFDVYLPLIQFERNAPAVHLNDAQTQDLDGVQQNIFYLWDTVQYALKGVNTMDNAVSVNLSWNLDGPCGPTEVFSGTLVLPPGEWEYTHDTITPECNGAFTATAQVDDLGITTTLTTTYIVNLEQAFDRCRLPAVGEMQAWWDSSPYTVWNIYLGGIHFACPNDIPTSHWVDSVAQQGWDFILTWVGPQAPCSSFEYTFSPYWLDAYWDGVAEAQLALAAADALGITGEKIIYYDLEGYPEGWDNPNCRYAAAMFIQGWTQELHSNGVQAGAYGSSCSSYMTDWTSNQPPPDDVWIAHWLLPPQYRPDATVWDASCLSNNYWPDHQRIRQYAGDHYETWGGVELKMDSSVVDGETVSIFPEVADQGLAQSDRKVIRAFDLVNIDLGWVLIGNQLFLTDLVSDVWREVTPVWKNAIILDVDFLDADEGWVVIAETERRRMGNISLYHTLDGGDTWDSAPLAYSFTDFSGAELDFIDSSTGWLVLKQISGSSFSLGRMYVTHDGGSTWNERPAPLGEPVFFIDKLRGWMVGGPAGKAVYRTLDGGQTWETQTLQGLPDGKMIVGSLQAGPDHRAILPVTVVGKSRTTLVIYVSVDDGTWQKSQEVTLSSDFKPGTAIPFSSDARNGWFAAADSSLVQGQVGSETVDSERDRSALPPGIVQLDFLNQVIGWALVQDGKCNGDKMPGYQAEAELFTCSLDTRLFRTVDGGAHWTEIKRFED